MASPYDAPMHLSVQWTAKTVCGLKTSDKRAWPFCDARWVESRRSRGIALCAACTGQPEAEIAGQLEMW